MVTLPELLCPICKEHIKIGISWGICSKGHKFNIRNNIIDLLAEIDDEVLLEEEKHWDQYAIKGKTSIEVNSYIKAKIFKD
jgi:hypothetical protein